MLLEEVYEEPHQSLLLDVQDQEVLCKKEESTMDR
jgi:hypothetical protein